MSLADNLKSIRMLRGFSLREVEKATGISNAYLSQLERSKASNPSPKMLAKLAEHYRVDYRSLLKAAGYLHDKNELHSASSSEVVDLVSNHSIDPGSASLLQQVILDAGLDSDEEKMVAEYIAFLRSRKK